LGVRRVAATLGDDLTNQSAVTKQPILGVEKTQSSRATEEEDLLGWIRADGIRGGLFGASK
jgi:hypothetical protein